VRAIIETSRLILRPFESSDAEAAFAWFGDPIVMRFTPAGPDTSLDQTKVRLTSYQEHQTTHGFSKWIILDCRLGCVIGDSGLLELREYGWINLSFRLAQPCWGKGLATEAASAWVHAAFHDLHLDRLTAFVHPRNYPSIRILEKLAGCGKTRLWARLHHKGHEPPSLITGLVSQLVLERRRHRRAPTGTRPIGR
jgi:ribosomal-protein-alanine N-acetyltransferase